LAHYLCNQKPTSYDGSIPGFLAFTCGGHRVVSTMFTLWAFDVSTFLEQWNRLIVNAALRPDARVWVGQARWTVSLADDLKRYPELQTLQVQSFGRNIQFFALRASQVMPKPRGQSP